MTKHTTHHRILYAAMKVFSTHGFGGPLRLIAKEAGVDQVTVVRHFKDKPHLRKAVMAEVCGQLSMPSMSKLHDIASRYSAAHPKSHSKEDLCYRIALFNALQP